MSLYTTTMRALNRLFKEPDGMVNATSSKAILESAAKKIFSVFLSGAPGISEVVLTFVTPVAMTFKAALADSQMVAGTGATAETVFNIKTDGGATWGTVTFAIAGTVGTFAAATEQEIPAGSLVTVTAPASADATLADIALSLTGYA